MPIVVTCPSCSTTLKAPDSAAGKKVKCPKCTAAIEVPVPAAPILEDEFTEAPPPVAARGGVAQRGDEQAAADAPPMGQINRQSVGILAVMFGHLGVHQFILGNTTGGLIRVLVSLFGCGVGLPVMLVIGIMEGIKYLRMSDAEFYDTYVVGKKPWL